MRLWKVQTLLIGLVYFLCRLVPCIIAINTDDNCWNSHSENNNNLLGESSQESTLTTTSSCIISATLLISGRLENAALPVEIDCTPSSSSSSSAEKEQHVAAKANLLRLFEPVHGIILDGCHTHYNSGTSYGLEYLPKCDRIEEITVKRFHADLLQQLKCNKQIVDGGVSSAMYNDNRLQTEVLTFRNNEIASITAMAFENLKQLRELYFDSNSLRHIESNAFAILHVIDIIRIENEPLLAIKEQQHELFKRTSVAKIYLVALKRVTPKLCERLPESLKEIHIERTAITDANDAAEDEVVDDDEELQHTVLVTNPHELRNITLIGCFLKSFTLNDTQATVLSLNLSRNALMAFYIEGNGTNVVESLDLSENQLSILPLEWLELLPNIKCLNLRGNFIKTFALNALLVAAPSALYMDLRNNRIESLQVAATVEADKVIAQALRMRIDRNPWNCMWLLNFAHTQPEQFRIFQYEKFISQINVNGLACRAVEKTSVSSTTKAYGKATANETLIAHTLSKGGHTMLGKSTNNNSSSHKVFYSNSVLDFKRNQRAEALIIVFMLPLGIAMLFLLLYLWIYCQKVFHLSYYRSIPFLPCCGRKNNAAHSFIGRSAERFDIIRHMPPTNSTVTFANDISGANNNDAYEIPLDGVVSTCNCCSDDGSGGDTNVKCCKTHHITYEALPDEQPYKIYEEIMERDEDDSDNDIKKNDAHPSAASTLQHPFYDHLTYEDTTLN